jgi:hypothetical protein
MMSRYALADRLYVLAPRGVIRPRELPLGWGLMECPAGVLRGRPKPAGELAQAEVSVAAFSAHHAPRTQVRARLLRNIAVAATRESMRIPSAAG